MFIETLNLRNAGDAANAESRRFRRRIGRGIAEGITRLLSF